MLAEYFAPLPMATGCTSAVCTGKGSVSAEFCCLHAVSPAISAAARMAIENLADAGLIAVTLPPALSQRQPSRSRRKAGFVRIHVRRWPRRLAAAADRASGPRTVLIDRLFRGASHWPRRGLPGIRRAAHGSPG